MKRRDAGRCAAQTAPLFPGEARDVAALSQWYTSPKAAQQLHDWARIPAGARCLEPSAGRGALIRPRPDLLWWAVDIDPANASEVSGLTGGLAHCHDFLDLSPCDLSAGLFHYVVMNPPYEDGAALEHVLHALEFAERVICIVSSDFEHGVERWDRLWRWVRDDWRQPHGASVRKLSWVRRPKFGAGGGAMSDFVAYDLPGVMARNGVLRGWKRDEPRGPDDALMMRQSWA